MDCQQKVNKSSWICSRAHEWVEALPLSSKTLKCVVCGIETFVGQWNVPRCQEHFVGEKSGWSEE